MTLVWSKSSGNLLVVGGLMLVGCGPAAQTASPHHKTDQQPGFVPHATTNTPPRPQPSAAVSLPPPPVAAPAKPALTELQAEGYALDSVSREIAPRGPFKCPEVELTVYRGTTIRYTQPFRGNAHFVERLKQMEVLIADAATRRYGRVPKRLTHLGGFNCRRIGGYPEMISEHGVGNALDLEGFDFGPLPKGVPPPDNLPKALHGPFRVRVMGDWNARIPTRPSPIEVQHAAFLREITSALIARRTIFRVHLGPDYPGHFNHFHFDCSPFRMVRGFGDS